MFKENDFVDRGILCSRPGCEEIMVYSPADTSEEKPKDVSDPDAVLGYLACSEHSFSPVTVRRARPGPITLVPSSLALSTFVQAYLKCALKKFYHYSKIRLV